MNKRYKRSDRVADLVQKELSFLLQRRTKDPRLEGITITGVKVTDDLRKAIVYYSALGKAPEIAGKGLKSAKSMMRREMGQRIVMKYIPDIEFRYDTSLEYAARIETLLKEISDGSSESD